MQYKYDRSYTSYDVVDNSLLDVYVFMNNFSKDERFVFSVVHNPKQIYKPASGRDVCVGAVTLPVNMQL